MSMGLEYNIATLKNSLKLSDKVKLAYIFYLAILLGYLPKADECPQRDLNKTSYSGFIHNDPKLRAVHMSSTGECNNKAFYCYMIKY